MKNQYFGDINDYRKYGLLRCIAEATGERIGVCWMLTADDGGRDGRKRDYLARHEEYRHYDEPLFRALSKVTSPSQQHVRYAERWNLIPNAAYYTELLHDTADRERYFGDALKRFKECGIVFFDPDNGLETATTPKGRKNSSKYLYWDELAPFAAAGKSLVIYQHFPRVNREKYVAERAALLKKATGAKNVMAFQTAHVVFFVAFKKRNSILPVIEDTVNNQWANQFKKTNKQRLSGKLSANINTGE